MSQNTNSDFDKIFLTLKEHFILFSLRIIKRQHGNIYDTTLYPLSQYGLISENYMPNKDSEGSLFQMEPTRLPTKQYVIEFTAESSYCIDISHRLSLHF